MRMTVLFMVTDLHFCVTIMLEKNTTTHTLKLILDEHLKMNDDEQIT